ncbi:unnamed protein product, partial [Discosporangium mesarthrocarpum]
RLEGEGGPEKGGVRPSGSDLQPHKWHPHTVKVLNLVRKQLKSKPSVTYASLTRGAKRRTAAGAFFELLQLKTWDFVELGQAEPYGDISVTPAVRVRPKP